MASLVDRYPEQPPIKKMSPSLSVSVVIPVHNARHTVTCAIDSVLNQSMPVSEIVIVDDGSKDDTAEIVANLAKNHPQIRLVRQSNGGPAKARNAGIQQSRSEWVAFLDADDQWLSQKNEEQLALLQRHPELVWIASGFHRCAKDLPISATNFRLTTPNSSSRTSEESRDALQQLAGRSTLWTGTIMVRKSALEETGLFDTALRVAEDSDLWMRLALRFPRIGYVEAPLAIYVAGQTGSLTGLAARSIQPSQYAHYQKILSFARDSINPQQKQLLGMILDKKINAYAISLIRTGEGKLARSFIRELGTLGLPGPSIGTRLASWVPGALVNFLRYLRNRNPFFSPVESEETT